MLELRPDDGDGHRYLLGVAGDTYNTAAGLAQLGCQVEYLTGLGEDRHSDRIVSHMQELGVGSQWLHRARQHQPGLYLIDNDDSGERFFSYWRRHSAAHQCLRDPDSLRSLLDRAGNCPRLMFSGITLALCQADGRALLLDWLQAYRRGGGQVIYDGNYRKALWVSAQEAGVAHRQVLEVVDLYLPGVEDELVLRQLQHRAELQKQLACCGCTEIVLKDGPEGIQIWKAGKRDSVAAKAVARVVDTSGAGDSFNAGYLAARIRGCDPVTAAGFAGEVAAATICNRGAILPQPQWAPLRQKLQQISAA
jgi:2-dehydro-3-deoxygluconokinase